MRNQIFLNKVYQLLLVFLAFLIPLTVFGANLIIVDRQYSCGLTIIMTSMRLHETQRHHCYNALPKPFGQGARMFTTEETSP